MAEGDAGVLAAEVAAERRPIAALEMEGLVPGDPPTRVPEFLCNEAKLTLAMFDRPVAGVRFSTYELTCTARFSSHEFREPKIMGVLVHRIRKHLPPGSVESLWGLGCYRLTGPGRAVIAEWLGDAA